MKTLDPKLVRVFPLIISAYKERLQQFQELKPNDVYQMMKAFYMNKGICYFSSSILPINERILAEVIMLDLSSRNPYWFKTPQSIVEDHLMVNTYLNLNEYHKIRMLASMQFRIDKMEELLAQHNISLCL